MSRTASVSGIIAVQAVGAAPAASATISPESASADQLTSGRKQQANNTTEALNMGAVTAGNFIWIRALNAANGNADEVQVNINSIGALPLCGEFMFVAPSSSPITSVAITTPNDGNAVDIDYIIAGN